MTHDLFPFFGIHPFGIQSERSRWVIIFKKKSSLFETIDQLANCTTSSKAPQNPFINHWSFTDFSTTINCFFLAISTSNFGWAGKASSDSLGSRWLVSRATRDQNQINPHQWLLPRDSSLWVRTSICVSVDFSERVRNLRSCQKNFCWKANEIPLWW